MGHFGVNMSYCRFENTYKALAEVMHDLEVHDSNGLSMREVELDELSSSERNYKDKLYDACQEFIALVDEMNENNPDFDMDQEE